MSAPKCGKCLLSEFDGAEFAHTIAEHIALIPKERKTPAAEYAQRLEKCRQCSALTDGLCGECGCFAELRAAKKIMKCPINKW